MSPHSNTSTIQESSVIGIGFNFFLRLKFILLKRLKKRLGDFFKSIHLPISWSVCSLLSEVMSLEGQIEKLELHQGLDPDQGENVKVSWRLGKDTAILVLFNRS